MPKEWKDTVKALKKSGKSEDSAYAIATWLYKKKHGGKTPQSAHGETLKEVWNDMSAKERDVLLNASESYIAPTSREAFVYKNWDEVPKDIQERLVTEFMKDYELFVGELNSIKEFSNITSCPDCANLETPETSAKPTIIQNPVPEIQAKGTYSTIHDGPGASQILQEMSPKDNPKTIALLIKAGISKKISAEDIVSTLIDEGVSDQIMEQAIALMQNDGNESSSPVMTPYEDPVTVGTLIEHKLNAGIPAEEIVNELFLNGVTEGTMNRAIKMLRKNTTEIPAGGKDQDISNYLSEQIDEKCHICEVQYTTRRDLAKHILEKHGLMESVLERKYKCDCGDKFDNYEELYKHQEENPDHSLKGLETVSGPPAASTMRVIDSEPEVLPK